MGDEMNIIELHFKLAELGLVYGTSGNASILDRVINYLRIKESGSRCDHPKTMQVGFGVNSDMLYFGEPSTDLPLHLAVYESNPEINCVIHTHSVHAATYSILGMELDTFVTGTAELFGYGIPCVAGGTNRDAIIPNLRLLAAPARGIRACLMERHGVLAWGKTSEEALHVAEAVEWSAQITLLVNGPPRKAPMSGDDIIRYQLWYNENYGQK